MKITTVITALVLAFATLVAAWPGMAQMANDIRRREGNNQSLELIGDLVGLHPTALTPVGRRVRNILLAHESAESDEINTAPHWDTQACAEDTCCVWYHIAREMAKVFNGDTGICTKQARGAIRLGFHDAAAFSKTKGKGGADGSIVLVREERDRRLNHGLEGIIAEMEQLHHRWHQFGISMADLIQMAATVAAVSCPEGPRIRSFVGRRDSRRPAPEGLLPDVNDSADTLIRIFRDKTIEPMGLAALLGAHSVSQQRFVDPSRDGDPQDSTPGVLDTKYYRETLGDAPKRVLKFKSDVLLSQDPRMFPAFREFSAPEARSQAPWNAAYAREYVRLSLLGVDNINELADCTWVLPAANHSGGWKEMNQVVFEEWTDSEGSIPEIADSIRDGESIDIDIWEMFAKTRGVRSKLKGLLKKAVKKVKGFWKGVVNKVKGT
ncbi:versatile peroxidase VPL1 [Podospora conica]|nr:versatile peroxidase VPL1 [Schizothecium conicum]